MNRGVWSSRFGFLMASIGFAVGLGNIWRFPYMVGENGGSAFILIYLTCAFLIGVPILMAEIMIGRRGQSSPESSMRRVAVESSLSPAWAWVGGLNLLTAFLILFVYSVVAGWVLFFFYHSLASNFSEVGLQVHAGPFKELQEDFGGLVFWSFLTLLVTSTIVVFGVRKGIERTVKLLIPLLVLLLVCLALFNVSNGGMPETLEYMFSPDFSELDAGIFLAAVSQAFFSIGVAMGGMMIFGSYLPTGISIAKSAVVIVLADSLIAILAGLVIFPLVFQNNLSPDSGTGLIFTTLPMAFDEMLFGGWLALVFFLLLSVAAITSMVGFMEPLVAFLIRYFDRSRLASTVCVATVCFACSALSAMTMSDWSYVNWFGRDLSEWLDFIPNSVLLPLGGLLICIFSGWFMGRRFSEAELALEYPLAYSIWFYLMRWLVAPALLVILIMGVID